jgi:hypothetical protein
MPCFHCVPYNWISFVAKRFTFETSRKPATGLLFPKLWPEQTFFTNIHFCKRSSRIFTSVGRLADRRNCSSQGKTRDRINSVQYFLYMTIQPPLLKIKKKIVHITFSTHKFRQSLQNGSYLKTDLTEVKAEAGLSWIYRHHQNNELQPTQHQNMPYCTINCMKNQSWVVLRHHLHQQ